MQVVEWFQQASAITSAKCHIIQAPQHGEDGSSYSSIVFASYFRRSTWRAYKLVVNPLSIKNITVFRQELAVAMPVVIFNFADIDSSICIAYATWQ